MSYNTNIISFYTDYSFPYLSIIISMISNAAHFSVKLNQEMKSLVLSSLTEVKNAIFIGKYKFKMKVYDSDLPLFTKN